MNRYPARSLRAFLASVTALALTAILGADEGNQVGLNIQANNKPGIVAAAGSADHMLFTGAFTYSVPIDVPPGINGMQPGIALTYNSQGGESWISKGWEIPFGSIQRSTRNGPPSYTTNDTFVAASGSQLQELISVDASSTSYRAKIEGGFQKFVVTGSSWTVYDKMGTRYIYGLSASARVEFSSGTFLWALERVIDRNGNFYEITYSQDQGQIYPSRIVYGCNANTGRTGDRKIEFTFEAKPDPFSSWRPAFKQVTAKRLLKVETYVVQSTWTIVKRYQLVYSTPSGKVRPALSSVQVTGIDGGSSLSLPPMVFTSTTAVANWVQAGSVYELPEPDFLVADDRDIGVRFGDLDGDGRIDVVRGDEYPIYNAYLNKSNKWQSASQWDPPIPFVGNNGDRGARLVDLNGDGRVDLVRSLYFDTSFQETRLNNGNGWDNPSSDWILNDGATTYVFIAVVDNSPAYARENGVQFVDMNGDGRPDLVQNIYFEDSPGTSVNKCWLNTGHGWNFTDGSTWRLPDNYWSSVLLSGSQVCRPNGMALIDLNGDGLTDVLYARQGQTFKAFLNKGPGWEDVSGVWSSPDWLIKVSTYSQVRDGGVQFADINGDGLTDWVQSAKVPCTSSTDVVKRVYLNTGSGWQDASASWTMPGYFTNGVTGFPGCNEYIGSYSGGYTFLDVNGDGQQDLVQSYYKASNTAKYVGLSQARPDVVTQLAEVFGGTTTVTYAATTLPGETHQIPFPLQVMKQVERNDGRGTIAPMDFSYFGGLFDPTLREPLGFSSATATDSHGDKTASYFLQKVDSAGSAVPLNGLKGKTYRIERVASDGTLMSRQETSWTYPSTATTSGFVCPISTETRVTEFRANGTVDRITKVQFTYDLSQATTPASRFGNLIASKALGDVNVSTDDRNQSITYAVGESTSVVLTGFPATTLMTDYAGSTVAASRVFYDGLATSTPVLVGNATESQQSLFLPTSPASPSPVWISIKTAFNSYGQPVMTTDPLTRTTSFYYDNVGLSSGVVNALGHAAFTSVDPRTGQVLSSTDTNNQLTQYVYDPLGRILKEIGPLDTATYPTVVYDYHNNLIGQPTQQYVEQNVREKYGQSGTIWTKSYMDGLGRTYRAEREDTSSRYVVAQTVFDDRGLPVQSSVPRFNTDGAIQMTTTTYDAAGRVIQVTPPDGLSTLTIYDGRTTSVQDPNNHVQQSVTDGFGRVIVRREPDIANPTNYSYDAAGNLVAVTDSLGKQTTFAYDSLGRKVAMYDVNAGSWTYVYDDVGNLTSQTDARGVRIDMDYDPLNRIVSKTLKADPAGYTGQSTGTILGRFVYDEPSHSFAKGRLTTAYDASTSTSTAGYDDQFTQANAVNPAAHTMNSGPGWTGTDANSGKLKVGAVANKLTCTATSDSHIWVNGTPPTPDYAVIAHGRLGSGATANTRLFLHARWDTTNDTEYYAVIKGDSYFFVTYQLNGVDQYDLIGGSTTINATTDYKWELRLEGDQISLLKDDVVLGSATDSAISTAGKVGISLRGTEPEIDLWQATWSSGTADSSEFNYDRVGRVIQKTRTVDNVARNIFSTYDAMDRLTSLTYPSGRVIDYAYDGAGRLFTVKGGTITYASYPSYNALGKPLQFDQSAGKLVTTYTYDPLKQTLLTLKTTSYALGSAALQQYSYDVDGVGNILSIDDLVHADRRQTFSYDSLNRLTFAHGAYGDQTYSYDSLGNLQQKGPLDLSYVYTSTQPYAVRASSATPEATIDSSTLVAWSFEPSESIYTISGTAQNTAGSATGNIPVALSGPANVTILSSTASPVGKFEFRNIPGGVPYSVALASAGMIGTPLGLTYSPLSASSSGNTLRLVVDTQPIVNASTLQVPRTRWAGGTPSITSSQAGYDAGALGPLNFGGWESSDTASGYLNLSGYAPLLATGTATVGYDDQFTQASAVNPAAHTMNSGPGWTGTDANSGKLKIGAVVNKLTCTATSDSHIWVNGTPPTPDYAVIAHGRLGSGATTNTRLFLHARWDTTNDTEYYAVIKGDSYFFVTYQLNGVDQYDLIGGSTTINATTDYTWELRLVGNQISLLKDGVILGSATDAAISSAGKVGISLRGTEPQIDSWQTTWISTGTGGSYMTVYSTPAASGFAAVGPSFTTGKVSQALAFNGISDAFVFPDSANLTPSAFSLMAVVKATQTPTTGYATILAKSTSSALGAITSGTRLLIDTTGKARFEVGRSTGAISVVSASAVPLNSWVFLAATYDGGQMKLYVNGALAGSASCTGAISNGNWLTAGTSLTDQFSLASGTAFLGSIDEPRFQGRAWSEAEISAAAQAYSNAATYTYDPTGNLLTTFNGETTTYYRYDAQGRLSEVKAGTSTLASYVYTSEGERVKQMSSAGTTLYVDRVYEVRPDGSTVDHLYGSGSPISDIAVNGTTTTTHFVSDHLGSIRAVTDNGSTVLQELAYAPFGETVYAEGTSTNLRRYTGQIDDAGIELYFYNARYYSAGLGRFVSPDKIVSNGLNPQFLGRYAYVLNQPIRLTDPNGTSPFDSIKKFSRFLNNTWNSVASAAMSAVNSLGGHGQNSHPRSDSNSDTLEKEPETPGSYKPGRSFANYQYLLSANALQYGAINFFTRSLAYDLVSDYLDSASFERRLTKILGHEPSQNEKIVAGLLLGAAIQEAYTAIVGYAITDRPGTGADPDKEFWQKPTEGKNNFGNQGQSRFGVANWDKAVEISSFNEGETASAWMNQNVYLSNAGAGLHDTMQISLGGARDILNYPGMLVAAPPILFGGVLTRPDFYLRYSNFNNSRDSD